MRSLIRRYRATCYFALAFAISWGGIWYRCSVSTCNKKRLPLHFCSPDCWDAHLPDANHRGPLCIEERAPYRP